MLRSVNYFPFALLSLFLCGVVLPTQATADVILSASGTNTFLTNEFFTVSADDLPSGLTVDRIAIDLQGGSDPDDVWDSDQVGGNSPWGFRNGTGISVADVLFTPAPGTGGPHGSILEMIFTAGTFGEGDSFTFDFDTDFTITDGDEFAEFGVTATITLSNGAVYNTVFADDGLANNFSTATFAVPEPASLPLMAAAFLSLILGWRKPRKHSRS